MQFGFGSGDLFAVNNAANSTPIKFGTLQDVTIDLSFSIKELFGQYQFPVAVARGTGKIGGKAKFGAIDGRIFNDIFFGLTYAVGQQATAVDEAGLVPTTPFQVTVANAANFVGDLGVRKATDGSQLVKVASAPATGQYSVSAVGVYTFAAADTGMSVLISYTHNVAASGHKILITNQLQGSAPTFRAVLTEKFENKALSLELYSCTAAKLGFATKMEDFVIPELDFAAQANAAGQIGLISVAE